ncbi:transcriptional regulator, LacI family [Pseudarthrobacter chlorophenolicus A6]|uniref:Transcriptional regulator, LacI family n=1 Tax=Pseudarthrobacter chlorophenolicus (strain ATCC 700700 / DSM 12829 / CIP 107037 / JCM 12360 / KCTC 9906 / NCIMB 13794 / A6) TaxID=452863 RepID=B8HFA2_PSECP|nr:LacI family DNA-binding transcriptional regulator [Pseudarthrobacter chlorophenolicus]ACL41070.1 transcriptional regulator, LacI family [Pseudarthrobacter chlorophenolicus A6]SDQ70383.1 transcriptional regulator, LacI family [Pseudarthrobacter chlorophenolicus]
MNRTASIKDVANHASVAVGTVSNVLNYPDRVSQRTKERVLKAIDELGFVRNDAARQLRAGHSRTVGLIVLDVGNPFFTSVVRAAEDAASVHGSAVLLGDSGHDAGREANYIDLFQEQRVQGLLISPVGDVTERLDLLRERGVPTVLVDRLADESRFSSVSVDDDAGGYLAARHLLETGRRRLAFVGGPTSIRQVSDRLQGAQRAVGEKPDATLEVLASEGMTVLAGRSVGNMLVERGRADLPDGIFCANDLLALGVMQSLTMTHTFRIPEDVALIGYDDIDFAVSAVVPLSSIQQPTEALGRTAIELLTEEVESQNPTHRAVVFTPELVVRQSTGKA